MCRSVAEKTQKQLKQIGALHCDHNEAALGNASSEFSREKSEHTSDGSERGIAILNAMHIDQEAFNQKNYRTMSTDQLLRRSPIPKRELMLKRGDYEWIQFESHEQLDECDRAGTASCRYYSNYAGTLWVAARLEESVRDGVVG
jgi:hypothetical protein